MLDITYAYSCTTPPMAEAGREPCLPCAVPVPMDFQRSGDPRDLSHFIPLKKDDATDTADYKPTAVGEPFSRLYASILLQRLPQITEQHDLRFPTQAGHRPERSTTYQAFVLQHVVDKHRCLKTPLYLCFVDLKSAYGRVQWPLLWDLL